MKAEFWHQKWEKNEIGFHEGKPNQLLTHYFERLSLPRDARIFLPLCGKTRDIAWLLDRGMKVSGAELSERAIQQLFDELGIQPAITSVGELLCYESKNISIHVGDFFALTADTLGPVDAVYDRAALVALPEETRKRYTQQLQDITLGAAQLLISFEYDQSKMDGPPFSISAWEVHNHYAGQYSITPLVTQPMEGGLKGQVAASETVWLLSKPV